MTDNHTIPDWKERKLILNELEKNIIVEAAAGTGKTTLLVGRMISLLIQGKCEIQNIVAITFTKKASSELRTRFRIELEKKCLNNSNLQDALENLEKCFIGTIHSFCARILAERPVEAGVNIPFEEIEPEDDLLLRQSVWEEYISGLYNDESEQTIHTLDSLGIQVPDLLNAFLLFTDYPDVSAWPGEGSRNTKPFMEPVLARIRNYATHMEGLYPRLPVLWKNDELIPFYREFPRAFAAFDPGSPRDMYELLLLFDKNLKQVQKEWTKDNFFTKEECKEEKTRWNHFREQVIRPILHAWRICSYGPVMELLKNVCVLYDDRRRSLGKMNFQDLLMKAAYLLRENSNVRLYFQKKYTHLLIDEFQDTDPVQAEVMMFLTAKNIKETDFRKCIPVPGSLFVVGDPKQSIYRFRRADIVTYNEVKRIMCESKNINERGILIRLSANFRSTQPIRDWVNNTFRQMFPQNETPQSPEYIPLQRGRAVSDEDTKGHVYKITVPAEYCIKNEQAAQYEAEKISRYIRYLLDHGGASPSDVYKPSDFMIITRKRKNLSLYADALEKKGVPYAITGGTTLNDIRELRLLYLCLKAVLNPDDPVALAGTLRSELFGFSDVKLYKYRQAGGKFSIHAHVPDQLDHRTKLLFTNTFKELNKFREYFNQIPAVSACEKIIGDLGLMPLACLEGSGHLKAGGLVKCIELIRSLRFDLCSPIELVHYLKTLIDKVIMYDGISVMHDETDVVRIMNLHQAKGLEARVVFLSDPAGTGKHDPEIHIVRTGNETMGYMMVQKKSFYHNKPIAYPEDWDNCALTEREFLAHEDIRLMYVAATRAKETLVIVQKEKKESINFWTDFKGSLSSEPGLPDYGEQFAPIHPAIQLGPEDIQTGLLNIESNFSACLDMTYQVKKAKEYALHEYPAQLLHKSDENTGLVGTQNTYDNSGEHGIEWGEVIHRLLDVKMKGGCADPENLAGSLLFDYGLDPGLSTNALALVETVVQSDIWNRALKSHKVYTEIPFQSLLDKKNNPALTTIIRGVIDLIFLENNGWVLVDYKTDAVKSSKDLTRLKGIYTPQLSFYADTWEQITQDKVKEQGLYFISANKYEITSHRS